MLLDVSVKMKIIDFLQPSIKQKLQENIIITPKKVAIGIDCVLLSSPFVRMILGLFWPGAICPEYSNRDHNQRITWKLDVSQGGGRGLGETSQGRFSSQNR